MKRLAFIIVVGAVLSLPPPPAFALPLLTPLPPMVMKTITGQAGVDVWIRDVEVWQHVAEAVYTDGDGLTGASDAASVILSNTSLSTTFKAITADNGSLKQNYMDVYPDLEYSPLKIDVVRKVSLLVERSAFKQEAQASATVVAHIPTLEIVKTRETRTISIKSENAVNDGKSFLTFTMGPSITAQLGGVVEVTSH